VDAQGRILEVSNNSKRVEHEWHDNARVYFSAGRGPAVQRLRDAPAPVDFATFHNVSRDPSTCFPSSVSGMSVHIDRDRPAVLTRVWISMPARSLSFPLLMGGSATPLPLFDGSADAAGRGTGDSATAWERIEGLAFQHLALVEKEVRALLDAGADAEARQTIDEWVLATAQAHLAIISR
jgi:hypothetical protein